jgi:hypothetical protein
MPNNGGEHRLHGHAVPEHRLELRSVGSACAVGISEGFCYGPSVAGASVLNFACLGGDVVQHLKNPRPGALPFRSKNKADYS